MFVCGGFVAGERRAGVLARRGGPPGDDRREPARRARLARLAQPAALRRLPRARRHGRAVHRRRRVDGVQRRARRAHVPGQSTKVGDYTFTYARPTSKISTTASGRLEKISFGAVVEVRRDGKLVTTLRPSRGYFPSRDDALGPIGRFFEGEATSEIGLKAGLRGDLWAAMTPDKALLAAGRGGRQRLRRGRRQAAAKGRGAAARPGAARDLRRATSGTRPRDVPDHHLAARDVDLARRDHRLPRRADRDRARRARPAAPPRAGALRGARRAATLGRAARRAAPQTVAAAGRRRAALSAAPWTSSPCSSSSP